MRLHDDPAPELLGEIMTLETQNDRTLFFDSAAARLPRALRAAGRAAALYRSRPGGPDSTRKAVLSRADGVVFVADSQRSLAANNAEV